MSSLFSLAVKRLIQMLGKDWGTPEYDTPVDESQVRDLTANEMNAIFALVGGKDRYNAMTSWAWQVQGPEWCEQFDGVIQVGDFERIVSLVKMLEEMYEEYIPRTADELLALNGVAEVPQ